MPLLQFRKLPLCLFDIELSLSHQKLNLLPFHRLRVQCEERGGQESLVVECKRELQPSGATEDIFSPFLPLVP